MEELRKDPKLPEILEVEKQRLGELQVKEFETMKLEETRMEKLWK